MILRADIRSLGVALAGTLAFLLLAAPASPAAASGSAKDTAVAAAKKARSVDITRVVNAPVPNPVMVPGAPLQITPLISTIEVGKRFRGLRIRDVNVTVQTVGVSGAAPAENLSIELMSPNRQQTVLVFGLFGFPGAPGTSIGPLTLDDEARLNLGFGRPIDATRLYVPWAGSATPDGPLAAMDNGPVAGTWTVFVRDFDPAGSSNLVSWRLDAVAGRPFLTK